MVCGQPVHTLSDIETIATYKATDTAWKHLHMILSHDDALYKEQAKSH